MFEAKGGGFREAIIVTLVALCFSIFVRCFHLKGWDQRASLYYYSGDKPLVTTMDGYYYLRLSRDYYRGNFESRDELSPIGEKPKPFSLLPLLTALIQKISKVPIEKIAFFIPVLLSGFMVLVYVAWGTAIGGPFLALSAAVIGGGAYYWYARTCLGRFDTDALIPVFAYGIPYLVYRFTKADRFPAATLWGATVLLCGILFYTWWLPALYAAPALIAGTYAISILAYNRSRAEKIVKMSILVAGCVVFVLVLLSYLGLLPQYKIFQPFIGLISLVTHSARSSEPSVSSSISELTPLTVSYFKTYVAGNWAILVFSILGFFGLLMSRKRELIFLLLPCMAGFMSFFSRRFTILLIPVFALSFGYALQVSGGYLRRKLGRTTAKAVIAVVLVAATYIVAKRALSTLIPPNLLAPHAVIAQSVNNGHSPSDLVWSWWDYGYFLEYFTEKRAFIDGGSQGGIRLFVSAYPFAQKNPEVSARWIRFFAHHGPEAIYKLNKQTGSTMRSVEFLQRVFEKPEDLPRLIKSYNLPDELNRKEYFFPRSQKVYVFIPFEMIPLAYWWYYYGTWNHGLNRGSHSQALVMPPGSIVDAKNGIILSSQGRFPIADLFVFKGEPQPMLYLDRHFRDSGFHAVMGKRGLYLMSPELKDSTFFKLLFAPYSVPCFRPVEYLYEYGGMWEVVDLSAN